MKNKIVYAYIAGRTMRCEVLPKAQSSRGKNSESAISDESLKGNMESAGQLKQRNAVADGGQVAEKHKSVSDASACISK